MKDKTLELAVIFKKKLNRKKVMIYTPVDIVLGYFDKEKDVFVTRSNEEYHFLAYNEYLYGFGLRKDVSEFLKRIDVKCKSFSELKNYAIEYLYDLKKYFYYLTITQVGDYKNLQFIAENKKNHEILRILDIDLENLKREMIALNRLSFDAKELSNGIKSEVIGQDEAIDDIVTVLWQNFRNEDSKSNILLVGPSGTGKTAIIRSLVKRLDIPMVIINATDLTPTAYRGDSISDCMMRLLKAADYDLEKASRGIIFIDEIDKKANTSSDQNLDVFTSSVQDELLKLLEDGEYQLNISSDPLQPKYITINTKNITFICSGAFSMLDKVKKDKAKSNKRMGFNMDIEEKIETSSKIVTEDLVEYGLKPEFVGRLPVVIKLNSLTKEDLIKIMKNPNNKVIQDKLNILNSLGIKYTIDEEVYGILADKALENKTGARGLVKVIDSLFMKAMQEISYNNDIYGELIITKETIDNPKAYKLIRK